MGTMFMPSTAMRAKNRFNTQSAFHGPSNSRKKGLAMRLFGHVLKTYAKMVSKQSDGQNAKGRHFAKCSSGVHTARPEVPSWRCEKTETGATENAIKKLHYSRARTIQVKLICRTSELCEMDEQFNVKSNDFEDDIGCLVVESAAENLRCIF